MQNEPATSTESNEPQLEMFPEIDFPENPTTTHLKKTVEWLLEHSDPYVSFMNNGPFVIGVNVKFVISNEGDTVDTPAATLQAPMYVLHEGMPEGIVKAFEQEYGPDSDFEDETVH